ncbi:MAG: phosphoribosylglycinamide formyltransferase [Betaproteobacteria bacterium]|nr:phosphoribosylglycinamide formyltransferase [Betaproteobacteria bacterium]
MKKIVVLVSGRGSNMTALLDACSEQRWNARIEAVISDRPHSPACDRARSRGVRLEVVDANGFASRQAFNQSLGDTLACLQPDLVVLAGFMRILPTELVEQYPLRMLNIHPSLLPAFPGLHTHRRALDSGARIHGATVHYVSPELDAGPIIAQAALAIQDVDTESTLAARVLSAEHHILPLAVKWHLDGRLQVDGARVRLDSPAAAETQSMWFA